MTDCGSRTATSRLIPDAETIKKAESDRWALAFARIECHYFTVCFST